MALGWEEVDETELVKGQMVNVVHACIRRIAETKGDNTSGTYTNIQTYGPLLETPNGKRITDDVKRWSGGSTACKA